VMTDVGQQAAIRGILQRDARFYKVSRGIWDLTKRATVPSEPKPKRVKRVLKEVTPTETKPEPGPEPRPIPVVLPGRALEFRPDLQARGAREVYLPEEVLANAPLAVLEEMWHSYVERQGDWAYLSPLHVSKLKAEIGRRKAGGEIAVKAPEIAPVTISEPAVKREVIGYVPDYAEKYSSPDPDLELVRQFNAPDAPIDLPVPWVREGPSPGSVTQEPLGPGQVGKTYTTGPGAIEEVVDETELRRKLERQKAKSRRRFQSPGWNAPTSMVPEKGSRTWFSSEDRVPPPGKWRVSPGWFRSEKKTVGKWKSFPGWFRSEAPVEPEYGRELAQEARVAWLEDRIMGWKERLRKGEVSEARFRNVTTYLYDQLEQVDAHNQLVAECYEAPVKRKELSDSIKVGVVLTAGLGIIGALLWKKSNRQ